MKTVVALLFLVATTCSTPLKWRPGPSRRYIPEEDDPFRTKYLLVEDNKGNIHVEDLTKPVPETRVTAEDVSLYLYTRRNPLIGIILPVTDLEGLKATTIYDPKKPNFFVVHGLNNNHQSSMNTMVKQAVLNADDVNVFIVDWNRLANKLYPIAVGAVPQIGAYLGDFINMIMDEYHVPPKTFKLIGHSLGAHVSGCAGAQVNGLVDYIIGLDPAGPLFTVKNTKNRLDESDAAFVHVIHTSSTTLGFGSSIGHADYYPNNGAKQPGCGFDIVGTCAHSRAYYYFEESVLLGGFNAKLCHSYKAFKAGDCNDNAISFLGTINVDTSASGDYYLDTESDSPYALG